MARTVPVISIVGKSGSGKTTFLEKLIPALSARGYKVGVVKHDVHGFEMDKPGKDTYRHFHAGAHKIAIHSQATGKFALISRIDRSITLDVVLENYFQDVDVILTEGYKTGDKPKIEIFRKDASPQPLCGPNDNCVAMVTDAEPWLNVPHFGLDDADAVAEFIEQKYLSHESTRKYTK